MYQSQLSNDLTPMIEVFTHEETTPSETTLNIIRQIAHTYRTLKVNGKQHTYCLN